MEMKDEDFAPLADSVKEAGAIMRGEVQASRRNEVSRLDIKSIREQTKKSQNDFAMMIGVRASTLSRKQGGRGTRCWVPSVGFLLRFARQQCDQDHQIHGEVFQPKHHTGIKNLHIVERGRDDLDCPIY
jgi:putative transcriptional regulator